jgi:hypothetical protein
MGRWAHCQVDIEIVDNKYEAIKLVLTAARLRLGGQRNARGQFHPPRPFASPSGSDRNGPVNLWHGEPESSRVREFAEGGDRNSGLFRSDPLRRLQTESAAAVAAAVAKRRKRRDLRRVGRTSPGAVHPLTKTAPPRAGPSKTPCTTPFRRLADHSRGGPMGVRLTRVVNGDGRKPSFQGRQRGTNTPAPPCGVAG